MRLNGHDLGLRGRSGQRRKKLRKDDSVRNPHSVKALGFWRIIHEEHSPAGTFDLAELLPDRWQDPGELHHIRATFNAVPFDFMFTVAPESDRHIEQGNVYVNERGELVDDLDLAACWRNSSDRKLTGTIKITRQIGIQDAEKNIRYRKGGALDQRLEFIEKLQHFEAFFDSAEDRVSALVMGKKRSRSITEAEEKLRSQWMGHFVYNSEGQGSHEIGDDPAASGLIGNAGELGDGRVGRRVQVLIG